MESKNMSKNAAAYLRRSTDRQDQSYPSCQAVVEAVRDRVRVRVRPRAS
jgi:hypothetical protein